MCWRAGMATRRSRAMVSTGKPTASQYFASICRDVFDGYFLARRFTPRAARREDQVRYDHAGGELFMSIEYYSAGSMRFWPGVYFGAFNVQRWAPLVTRNLVPLWYAMPVDSPLRDFERAWEFTDPAGCAASLTRVRDELLPVYAEALWSDPRRVRELVIRRDGELEEEFIRESDAHHRRVRRARAEA